MKSAWPTRLWVGAVLGLVSAAMLALTLVLPAWIERFFDLAPDGGDGSTEWEWAASFAVATLLFFADAGRVWWRARAPSASR